MIRYIGQKHLNSNFYESIILEQKNDFVEVKTTLDKRLKNVLPLKLNITPFMSKIADLSDYEKLEETVAYFLRNNKICEIEQSNKGIIVKSDSSRKLVLKIGQEYSNLMKMIIDKYNIDRLEYIDQCNQKNIHIRTVHFNDKLKIINGVSNYFEGYDKDNPNQTALVLTLISQKGEIATFDKKFIIQYIKDIIESCENEIYTYKEPSEIGLIIKTNDKKIDIPICLQKEVYLMVFNRNIEIKNMNNKQLKLEVIYGKINNGKIS